MNILVDGESIVGKPTGIGNYSFLIIENIISQNNVDLKICVPLNKGEFLNKLNKKVEIYEYGKILKRYMRNDYYEFIKKTIKKISPDIFWEPSVFVDFFKNFKHHTKIVSTIHDIIPITNPEFYHFYYRLYFKKRLKITSDIADMIMFISQYSKKEYEKFFKTNAKIKIVPPPIYYKSINDCIHYKITNKYKMFPYLLFLGYSQERKGIDILLDAYAKIEARIPHKLVIAGHATRSSLNKINRFKKHFGDKLIYLNYVSDFQRNELFENCDLFIFPSRAEGFGMPPVEALVRGKKVICSDIEVLRESTRNFAYYFDLKLGPKGLSDCIIDVLKNGKINKKFSDKLIEEFAPKQIAYKIMNNFYELIKG